MYSVPPVVTVAAGALTWLLGSWIVKRVKILSRYNLPAPVVGGILVALVFAVLHENDLELVKFNPQLVPAMMIAFFTSIGYGASVQELRKGGRAVARFLILCSVMLILQSALGIAVARSFGEPALFGVLTGNVALAGGPGTALSFAPLFEEAGVRGAAASGLSAAMLGTLLGGLLGGPMATMIIKKQQLQPASRQIERKEPAMPEMAMTTDELYSALLYHAALILIIGSAGYYVSKVIEALGIKLPFYIGGMIVASIVRNIEDKYRTFRIRPEFIDAIGGVNLTLFIAISMMSLELWTVAAVAGPLLTNLALQAAFTCVAAVTVVYWLSGRDYDAAVISGGTVGFMLGTTANALANMKAITERFGAAPRAFLVVPLVGACFIDFMNAVLISFAINFFH